MLMNGSERVVKCANASTKYTFREDFISRRYHGSIRSPQWRNPPFYWNANFNLTRSTIIFPQRSSFHFIIYASIEGAHLYGQVNQKSHRQNKGQYRRQHRGFMLSVPLRHSISTTVPVLTILCDLAVTARIHWLEPFPEERKRIQQTTIDMTGSQAHVCKKRVCVQAGI